MAELNPVKYKKLQENYKLQLIVHSLHEYLFTGGWRIMK